MRILVSNDDGYRAIGLHTLIRVLKEIADIEVVVPDRDRSGASNSLTLDAPLRVTQVEPGLRSVNGTPTDCVHIAITGLLEVDPDMVIAGINSGANLGDDILYSGTVAAAVEGRYLGYPAIAISLAGETCKHFDTAAYYIKILLESLEKGELSSDTILNINVPDLPIADIKGFQVTRLGNRHRAEPVLKAQDPKGRDIYWIGPAGAEQDAGEGTDFNAVRNGYISITPLQLDLTKYSALDPVKDWVKDLKL